MPEGLTPDGLAPRRAALNLLSQVRAGRSLDAAIDGALRGLDDADRRLAHEMGAGVLRRQSALDARLAPLVTRGWAGVPPGFRISFGSAPTSWWSWTEYRPMRRWIAACTSRGSKAGSGPRGS